jgi:hypothetical protein
MTLSIIPKVVPDLTLGEKKFLEILKLCYSNEIGVYIYIQPRIKNLEPDFIIIDPARGVSIVEIKDWKLTSLSKISRLQVDFKNGQSDDNPGFKAHRYFKLIQGVLEAETSLYDDRGSFIPLITVRLIMTKMDEEDLSKIYDEVSYYPCKSLSSDSFKDFSLRLLFGEETRRLNEQQVSVCRSAFFPEIKIKKSEDKIIKNIKVCDAEQEEFAKNLPYGHSMVSGVPGSGKTVIMLARALYLAKENSNWQILVITYNKSLASRLVSRVRSITDELDFLNIPHQNIQILTFHQLALKISNVNVPQNAKDSFWDSELPSRALASAEPLYDFVLIDEYQDFFEDWFRLCVKIIKPVSINEKKYTNLFLAGDRLQSIYRTSSKTWKELGIEIHGGGRSKLLKKSYRTAKSHISLALDLLMSDKSLAVDVDKFYEGREEIGHASNESGSLSFLCGTNSAIINHIFSLINQGGFLLSDILVLAPNWSVADEIFERLPQSIKKQTRVSKHFREDEMIITTYHSSKGLERKVVILVDVNSIKEKKVLYVGITRASETLYIHSYLKQEGSNFDLLETLASKASN